MKIAVIGAGLAGLTTGKTLLAAGHDVTIIDKAPDVGGVWSRTRRYPGVTTQSPMRQYSFSDFPPPKDYPEWPSGEQVQEYLESYAQSFNLEPTLRLNTEVVSAAPATQREPGWHLELRNVVTGQRETIGVDRLVVANGIFSKPNIPAFPGTADFQEAGGRVVAACEVAEAEEARDNHVLVVGYGKSACDVTVALSEVTTTTDVIARQLLWKVPRRIGGLFNFKYLLLSRLGEAVFRYRTLRGLERFLHGPGDGIRRMMLNSVGSLSVRQYGLRAAGLVPRGGMEDIVQGAVGLGTEGFFEGVADGTIHVHRDQTIERLLEKDGRPHAELSDGTLLPADLVVCATGYLQGVPFFDEQFQSSLLDERDNFLLYRQIKPIGVPGLYFNGYNSSFFCPLNAEIAGLWIAADLANELDLPSTDEQRQAALAQIAFLDEATAGHHSHGAKIIPWSIHNVDEVLSDLGVNIPRIVRAAQWLVPVDPAAFRKIGPSVIGRLSASADASTL